MASDAPQPALARAAAASAPLGSDPASLDRPQPEPAHERERRHEHADRPPNPKRATLTRRISFPDHALSPTALARLRRYLVCFALVDFDIDQGPNLDNAYPPTRLPPQVQTNLAFSSLPEGTDLPHPALLPDHGYAYHWRIPYPADDDLDRLEARQPPGQDAPFERLPRAEAADGALHGFVWFVREQDDRLRRGFSQRSLVLITHLPDLAGLFSSLVAILGPLHFKHAQSGGARGGMVETACHNIASWCVARRPRRGVLSFLQSDRVLIFFIPREHRPDPTPGTTVELPFLGSVLTVSLPLPSQAQFPLLSPSTPSRRTSLSSPRLSPTLLRTPRRGATSSLPPSHGPPSPFLSPSSWHSARAASHLPALTGPPAVLPAALPLTPLCLLLFPPYRPAPERAHEIGDVGYTKLVLLWELVVLGEPLLVWSSEPRVGAEVVEALKALIKPIPFAGDVRPYLHVHDQDFSTLCKPGKSPRNGARSLSATAGQPPRRSVSVSSAQSDASSTGATPAAAAGAGRDFGLKSERKRHVKKDEAAQREIEDAWRRGDYLACDAAIYRHFAALTERFLAPLNRYFGTLWAGNEAVATAAPLLSPGPSPAPSTLFSLASFLASLRTHGSSLPLKPAAPSLSQPGTTPLERFYARFIERSPHFGAWREGRVWARGRAVGEVDELVGRLEKEVVLLEPPSPSPSSVPSGYTSAHASPSPSYNPGLGIDSVPSSRAASPAMSLSSRGFEHGSGEAGPGAKLRAQAERLRNLRDERVRSLSLERGQGEGGESGQGRQPGCIFCGITSASEGFRVVHEDAEFVVFRDRSPGSKVHLLAVPKRHVVERMKVVGRDVLLREGVAPEQQRLGFHIPPFFSVNHLHLHLLSLPLPFPGSLKYRPSLVSPTSTCLKGFSWFAEVDQVINILRAGQRVKVGSVLAPAKHA
ncbi:hypothetical protein Rhopal_006735-T1 [Rhodotorula paludigena]|uniref:HIT domain-containing protein n=1 Tax=Rhodotorula paludigena TaxID=86838 RepID=A0AAV5GTY2_9BASI|nr:hypothetical protein Rhopal_006735-T1 [Rhodotorula paludigena]